MSPEQEPAPAGGARRRTRRSTRRGQGRSLKSIVRSTVRSRFFKPALVALAGLYVLNALYNWYLDARYYHDVGLGGTRNEALYALGPNPDTVEMASGWSRLDFRTARESTVSVTLNDSGRIDSVRCAIADGTAGSCPAMFRVAPGQSERDMYGWLGIPNRTSVAGDVLTADYTGLGIRFELRQFKIVAVTHYSGGDMIGHSMRFVRHLVFVPGGVI